MDRILNSFNNFFTIVSREYKFILKDSGVILIMFGAVLIYSTLYSLAYRNAVVREVPIGVIDLNNTSSSRQFARALNASPNVDIKYNPQGMNEAKDLFWKHKIYGVVLIPKDFEKDILSGKQTMVSIYADASYFLMYKQLFSATTSVIGLQNISIETRNFLAANMGAEQVKALSDPVKVEVVKLYNRTEGYAHFVMPAIMLLILQQTILIAVGIIGGTMREKGLYKKMIDAKGRRFSAINVVLGKAFVYFTLCSLVSFFIYGFYYKFFGYPTRGKELEVIMFFIPYILSSSFLGIALSSMFRHRETAILTLVVWSVPFLLFSGVSYPIEGMPTWFFNLGKIIPSSSAIDGFIRLQVMGATLKDIISQYSVLWILTFVYMVIAIFMMRYRLKKEI